MNWLLNANVLYSSSRRLQSVTVRLYHVCCYRIPPQNRHGVVNFLLGGRPLRHGLATWTGWSVHVQVCWFELANRDCVGLAPNVNLAKLWFLFDNMKWPFVRALKGWSA